MYTPGTIDRRMWRYRYTVLALCISAYFAIRFAQLVISPVIPAILDEFAVSRGAIGFALTGMWVIYALAQLPSGIYGDRFGERQVIVVGLGLTGAGGLLAATAPSYAMFLVLVLLIGCGAGLYYNAATALLTRLYDRIGRVIGIHRTGSRVAGLSAPIAAAATLPFGWRVSIVVGGIVALAVMIAFARLVHSTDPVNPETSLRDEITPETITGLLTRGPIAFPTAIAILESFALIATMSFLPTFLVEHHGFSIQLAGLLFAVYFGVEAVGQAVSGSLSDSIGRDAALGLTMVAGVLGYGLLVADTTLLTAVPAVVLAGVAMSWEAPLQPRVMEALDTAERGVGFGLVRTLYILFGAIGNTIVGTLADVAGWSVAFGFLAGMLFMGFCLLGTNRILDLGW